LVRKITQGERRGLVFAKTYDLQCDERDLSHVIARFVLFGKTREDKYAVNGDSGEISGRDGRAGKKCLTGEKRGGERAVENSKKSLSWD